MSTSTENISDIILINLKWVLLPLANNLQDVKNVKHMSGTKNVSTISLLVAVLLEITPNSIFNVG